MFSASPYNVQIIVEDDEPEERFLNRFRREVFSAGIIQECKRRKRFENPQDEKKRRVRDAAKRNRRNKFARYVITGISCFLVFVFVFVTCLDNLCTTRILAGRHC